MLLWSSRARMPLLCRGETAQPQNGQTQGAGVDHTMKRDPHPVAASLRALSMVCLYCSR